MQPNPYREFKPMFRMRRGRTKRRRNYFSLNFFRSELGVFLKDSFIVKHKLFGSRQGSCLWYTEVHIPMDCQNMWQMPRNKPLSFEVLVSGDILQPPVFGPATERPFHTEKQFWLFVKNTPAKILKPQCLKKVLFVRASSSSKDFRTGLGQVISSLHFWLWFEYSFLLPSLQPETRVLIWVKGNPHARTNTTITKQLSSFLVDYF